MRSYEKNIPLAERRYDERLRESMIMAKEWVEAGRPWTLTRRRSEERDRQRDITRAYRLAEIRLEQGLTQAPVAKVLHISQGRVSKIERGRRRKITAVDAPGLCGGARWPRRSRR